MARLSTIDTHPDKAKILERIASGVPAVDISHEYPGISVYAISRYKLKRDDVIRQVLNDDGTDPTEVLGRLLDLSDSARAARKLADLTATPAVRARVIAAELSVLDRLSRLSIDDTATARLAEAVGPLVRTIQKLSKEFPAEVLAALAEHAELTDLRNDLKTALRGQNGKQK